MVGKWGDDNSSEVYVAPVQKTEREMELEQDLKREKDPARKRKMERELDRLRKDRQSEDRRNQALAEPAREAKRLRIQEARLQSGSWIF